MLPQRAAVFTGAPLIYAGGRIAYVRRYEPGQEATIAITDLDGRSVDVARFTTTEDLESFAFDGARLAYAHTRWRPDQGHADDGLRSICVDDRVFVQDIASLIEVHLISNPGRLPEAALPIGPRAPSGSNAPIATSSGGSPHCATARASRLREPVAAALRDKQ